MDFADDFLVNDPLTFSSFLEGEFAANIFRFGIHYWIFFTNFGVLEISLLFFFTEFGVLELAKVDFTEFVVLEFFWNLQNPLFL